MAAAAHWCAAQLDAIKPGAHGARAIGPLLAVLIDDWCENQRQLAFAWRECELSALRDRGNIELYGRWHALWMDFWREICGRLGLADVAAPTAWLFDGASCVHLLRWRRAVDHAGLIEQCSGWARWLEGELADPAPWFEFARGEAASMIPPPPPSDDTAIRVAEAAAQIIAENGVTALTHRAVAAKAGLTLGVVSYKFRTSADLLQAAFEAIYRRSTPETDQEMEQNPAFAREAAQTVLDRNFPVRADLLASHELIVAAARDATYQAFSVKLRYQRGRSGMRFLRAFLGPDRPIAAMDAAIFSALLAGRGRAYRCRDQQFGPASLSNDLAPLFARMGL